ncbi:MAG: aminomethyl transferase family protein [Chloroflexi bacterium]|nr:aminomethyl transferase family protein [Chloroflexota bacterium]
MQQIETTSEDYQASVEGAVYRLDDASGYLRIGDEHQLDFLQRQTTNDVTQLAPGRSVTTVLANASGRITNVLTLLPESGSIGVIPLPGTAEALASYLKGRIFFMDRVTVTDQSGDLAQLVLDGPRAAEILAALGWTAPESKGMTTSFSLNGGEVRILAETGLVGLAYRLTLAPSSLGDLTEKLSQAAALEIDPSVYEIRRVEAGLPAAGHELSEDYTPLETGLADTVSDSKGCYTGQEVLARQVNYEKITKGMVGLRLSQPVDLGTALRVDGRSVGRVTSYAHSPRFGPISLAIIKLDYTEPGMLLDREDGGQATVAALPFAG